MIEIKRLYVCIMERNQKERVKKLKQFYALVMSKINIMKYIN
jgi:hypothetical protein